MSGVDIGILVEGDDCIIDNVVVGPGFNFAGVAMVGAKRTQSNNLVVDARNPYKRCRIGRNAPCPCGSGAKYKRCHGSVEMSNDKSYGIVSIDSSGKLTDTTVVADSGGVGVYRNKDRTDFERTTIIIGQDDIAGLVASLKLPAETPHAYVAEAISQVRESGSTDVLQYSKLRVWLMDNKFDMKFWAETAIAVGLAALGGAG
ncbi:SEC-C domain-containing protein [Pseudomonas alloputida]|uniref:YecA family protein n=1 Tax=Pseudomonas alloputida TaxID=1940621 RepID=UPI001E5C12B1|nr:SEC-C domain-containing protein [Pseudomonas alloputida]MCE1059103.1 SEC-C domain-containing protein [Pseudomonas alloputida]